MTIAERFADFIAGLRYEEVPEAARRQARLFFLDWLGSGIRGAGEEPTEIILATVREMKGTPEATVLADGSRNTCLMAALANGASSHVMEMDDLHRPGIFHPAATIFPAALAAGEKKQVTGKKLIEAVIAGYEIGIRAAVAIGKSHYKYWHNTGTCGTFGAAAATAKILNLNLQQTAWSLGTAGTQAAGLWEFLKEDAMSKPLHAGKAAMNGLLSSLLAQKGYTGARGIFEGGKGLFQATSNDYDLHSAIEGLGQGPLKIMECSLKKHASCGHTHSAIDAVLRIMARNPVSPEEITRMNVRLYDQAMDLLAKVEPVSSASAKFCLPFCVSTAVIYQDVGLEAFSAERLKNTPVLRLMEKVALERDPALTALYPQKWSAEVTLMTRGGNSFSTRVDQPKGDPENPLTEKEVGQKFQSLAQAWPREKRDRLIQRVTDLDNIKDVSSLLSGI